jgi:Rho GTPase-activating protein 1
MYVLSNEGEDEEDLDDDRFQRSVSPPAIYNPPPPPKRHKSTLSSESNSRSIHTLVGETKGSIGSNGYVPYSTYGKTKSTISIENGGTSCHGSRPRKGSITIGRGTTRKSSGASVEAIDVTAEGFSSPPVDDAPLVPDGKGGWKE